MEVYASLDKRGAIVSYHDLFVSVLRETRQYALSGMSISLDSKNIANQDCVVICTAPSNVEHEVTRDNARLIVNTLGVFDAGCSAIVFA